MLSFALHRSRYVPTTNRQRALAIALVCFVYAPIAVFLLTLRTNYLPMRGTGAPFVVRLLELPSRPEPLGAPIKSSPRISSSPPAAPSEAIPVDANPPVPSTLALVEPKVQLLPPTSTAASAAVTPAVPITVDRPDARMTAAIGNESDQVASLGAAAGGAQGPTVMLPRWIRRVDDDELFSLMDRETLRAPFNVTYLMRCAVAANTHVKCRILQETPRNPGVRDAVVAATRLLRMAPGGRDGHPVEGQLVQFLWHINYAPR